MFFYSNDIFSFNRIAFSALNVSSLEYILMNNQECKTRPRIRDVNGNEPVFYPYRIKVNKCSGSCNSINDPYADCVLLIMLKT